MVKFAEKQMREEDLHNYQLTTSRHIITNPYCGLFLDMGLGKTVSTLTAIKKLMFEELDINRVLVIAPKRVAENVWTTEVEKWEHLSNFKVSKIAGSEKKRKLALAEKADIYTIGRDNVVWLCGQYGGSMLPFDMLVIDESSSFKNPKALRFKALRAVQPSFKRIVLLTGTPAPNGLIDLWAQLYLLDRGERLGKFLSNYRDRFFNPGQTNGHIIYNYRLQSDGEERIHELISDICISMKAEDYLKLPGVILNDIDIIFPKALQDKYDEFEKTQVLEMFEDREDITAVNAAALSNKLLQFASGAVYDENKDVHVVHDLKLEAVEELIEAANGKPVLIAWIYRSNLYRLQERLKKLKPRELKTGKDIDDWNAGKIQVLLMHPASGGHGLNLQEGGNEIIWYDQTWSSELYKQLNARLDRQGKTGVTIINRLISKKTIDTDVVKAVGNKIKTQDHLIDAVKARIKKYVL
jgi:SNF2 family DNA or RNA helicase